MCPSAATHLFEITINVLVRPVSVVALASPSAKGVCLKAIGLLSICNFQTIYQTCRLPSEKQKARKETEQTEIEGKENTQN